MAIKNYPLEYSLMQARQTPGRRPRPGVGSTNRALPALSAVLEELNPLPRHTVFVGICEDGLPLMLDLTNPAPGSVLIVSEAAAANRALLDSLLTSIHWVNSPEDVRVHLVTSRPGSYPEMHSGPGMPARGTVSTDLPRAIQELSQLLSGRQAGQYASPTRVLFIDGLEKMLTQLDRDGYERLKGIVAYGPGSRVWVFATLNLDRATVVDDTLVEAFGTRLFGPILSPLFHLYLPGIPGQVAAGLNRDWHYCVEINGEAVRFWIPDRSVPDESYRSS